MISEKDKNGRRNQTIDEYLKTYLEFPYPEENPLSVLNRKINFTVVIKSMRPV